MDRQRCKMCGQYEGPDGFDELGYCDECESDAVANIVQALTKPMYVYRMARGITDVPYANAAMVLSARKRQKNAERDIIRIIASYT